MQSSTKLTLRVHSPRDRRLKAMLKEARPNSIHKDSQTLAGVAAILSHAEACDDARCCR